MLLSVKGGSFMKKKRIVVALGGNALGNCPGEQILAVRKAAEVIALLVEQGHEVIIGHGNGPQVGMINSAMNYASESDDKIPAMPFPECGAMSQGFIGYHLQQALNEELLKKKIRKTVVSVITQVLVDKNDKAFQDYTKPIGRFYTKADAEKLSKEKGYYFIEDSGRGYRRAVPSPIPQRIIELSAIRRMIQSGLIVITVGGGGIPVIEGEEGLQGIDAVIDKDRACERLAIDLKADILLILTAVDYVCINYNSPNQTELKKLTESEAEQYIKEGQFGNGSMLPKVQACLGFVHSLPGRMAVITSLNNAGLVFKNDVGTRFFSDRNVIQKPEKSMDDYIVCLDNI